LRVFSRVAFKFLGFTAVGISETIGVTVREYYGLDDVPIINNGISTREYAFCQESREAKRKELGLRDGTFACVHVGNFRIQKNHKLLVRAFAKALENKIDMVLLLIGDGRLRHETEVLIRELRVEDRIRLLGTRGDVASILSASDLFVFSSDWEGLPLSVTEAMAAGLPVVSTDAGGVVDLVKDGETGYIARRGDEDNLAAAILRAASDLEVARSLGKAAAAAVRDNFDISQAVSGHATLYKKLLKQAGGGDI
jgi:glycosyltransferase involved in cell wall biosynthesis